MTFSPVEWATCMHWTKGLVDMHLDILPGKRVRMARNLLLNISEQNSDVCKHQVISANHAGTPLYVSHNIRGWVDLGSSRASCSPQGLRNSSGDAPRSVPLCFYPEIWGHYSLLVSIVFADTWLGSDWLTDWLTDTHSLTDLLNRCTGHSPL
jgi:hypothetical protein